MNNTTQLKRIVERILREEDDKKQIATMDAAMANTFKTLGAEFEAIKRRYNKT